VNRRLDFPFLDPPSHRLTLFAFFESQKNTAMAGAALDSGLDLIKNQLKTKQAHLKCECAAVFPMIPVQ
jgi:hypothetical protein